MIKLALMCRKGEKLNVVKPNWDVSNLSLLDGTIMETGVWVVGLKKAEELIGHQLVLCSSRNSPSYVGGTILSANKTSVVNNLPRVTLQFKLERQLSGRLVPDWVEQNPVHYL